MQITIDTDNMSAQDLELLRVLVGAEPTEAAPATTSKSKAKPAAAKAEEPEGPDLSVAVAKATELVSAGETARVKDALKQVGVSRVSELTEDQVQTFLDLLDV